MKKLSLSVIMPNYNHAAKIGRAIEAIAAQSRRPDELIILDDASTDCSVDVIQAAAAKYPWVHFERNEQNLGVNRAFRKLRRMASKEYIYLAAADDEILPNFFETALHMAATHPSAGIVCGMTKTIDEHGVEMGRLGVQRWATKLFAGPDQIRQDCLECENHALPCSTIFRRAAFEEVGGYREELGCFSDTFAWYAVALTHGMCYVPELFSVWYRAETGFLAQSVSNPRSHMDSVGRVAYLMRSPEFRECFPEAFVRRWERFYRRATVQNYWRGEKIYLVPPCASPWTRAYLFVKRYSYRLPRSLGCLRLALHKSDLSCFQ